MKLLVDPRRISYARLDCVSAKHQCECIGSCREYIEKLRQANEVIPRTCESVMRFFEAEERRLLYIRADYDCDSQSLAECLHQTNHADCTLDVD